MLVENFKKKLEKVDLLTSAEVETANINRFVVNETRKGGKEMMKLDVYEKFIVLHTHTGKQRDYISTRREKETEKERGEHTQT